MGKTAKNGEVLATAQGVIVGTDTRSGAIARWRFAILVTVAVLVALVAGGTARWLQTRNHQPPGFQASAVQKKAESVQGMVLSGDYKGAQAQIDQELKDPKLTTDERVTLLSVQATTYENQKQYQKALDGFRQVDKLKPTQNNAESIGRVAEELGDKPAAIAAYKLAITRIDKNSPIGDAEKSQYQHMITNLGGQP